MQRVCSEADSVHRTTAFEAICAQVVSSDLQQAAGVFGATHPCLLVL